MSTDNSDKLDEFLFVQSITDTEKKQKPKAGYDAPTYDINEFDDDLRIRENTMRIKDQLQETVNVLSAKTILEGSEVFYEIYTKAKTSELEVRQILQGLKANVVAYVDRKRNGVLVSSNLENLHRFTEKEVPKYLDQKVRIIKALDTIEQIDRSLRNFEGNQIQMVVFAIIPNLDTEKTYKYLGLLIEFLIDNNCKIYGEELRKYGFILSDVYFNLINEILKKTTFIFKIAKISEVLASEIRTSAKSQKTSTPDNTAKILTRVNESLPTVVLMDSGVNTISELDQVIKEYDSYNFTNPNDEHGGDGHGTPIAYLIAFGDNNLDPVANIISYKIWSDDEKRFAFNGLMAGIEKYSSQSRLFVTSTAIPGLLSNQIVQLDKLAQSKNICLIAPAGNIDFSDIREYLISGAKYPDYLQYFPVLPPANGVNVIAVGSIAHKATTDSLAKKNQISPHSRCGKGNFELHYCKKPEVVENGGNVNVVGAVDLNSLGVGVSTVSKTGTNTDSLSGTSYSTPFFVRTLAEIEKQYGIKIKNVETMLAITYISAKNQFGTCGGYGKAKTFIGSDHNSAVFLAEGTIGFPKSDDNTTEIPFNDIIIYVPPRVNEIKICVVHSDDFKKAVSPTLETYVEIKAKKLGNDSIVEPDNNQDVALRTNTKILTYSFDSKSMESLWTFRLKPKTVNSILSSDRKNITVRYGCAILLSRKLDRSSKKSLTQEIIENLGRYSIGSSK